MAHFAFGGNLHVLSLSSGNHAGVQDPAVQQTVEKLQAVASPLLQEEGERAQLDFSIRTSEGRFRIQSFPGEPVKDLLDRIAYLALMPDHAGLETASVRKVRGGAPYGNGGTRGGLRGSSCISSVSTRASKSRSRIRSSINSSVVTDFDLDSNAHASTYFEDKSVVRFSEDVEQIFFGVQQSGKDTTPKRGGMQQVDAAPQFHSTFPICAAPMFFRGPLRF